MTAKQVLLRFTENCDVFFEGSLISKEPIIKKYTDFFALSIYSQEHSTSVALHTGSLCFDIMAVVVAALACISIDKTNADDIIASLRDGDMVLYKNMRCRWRGTEIRNNLLYLKVELNGRHGNRGARILCPYETGKGIIKPYNGTSGVTDGRGIKHEESNRADFISYITNKPISEIPVITKLSVVIAGDKKLFKRIQEGLIIKYNEKSICLSDIIPISYYTDGYEQYQFGNNPSKTEPVLKIAGKVSVARDIVLDNHGNKVIGLVVLGSEVASGGSSDLEDLLVRKSLKFTHVSMRIDSENAGDYIREDITPKVFACTREFLLQFNNSVRKFDKIVVELNRQIKNIINNKVTTHVINSGYSCDAYRKIRHMLFALIHSHWDEDKKRNFIVQAYSLLNLFTTAVFSMKSLESAVTNGEINFRVNSPSCKIRDLWKEAKSSDSFSSQCIDVVGALDDLYKSLLTNSPKQLTLYEFIKTHTNDNICIIVPKAYYSDILKKNPLFTDNRITIVTATCFNADINYDKIIVVGDFSGKNFDALKCKAGSEIIVLLYECETYLFKRRKREYAEFENKLNLARGHLTRLKEENDSKYNDEYDEYDDKYDDEYYQNVETLASESLDLNKYIDSANVFEICKFAARAYNPVESGQISEVAAIGRFVSGEHVLFSKFHKAVVYNPLNIQEPISETDVDRLNAGDKLVFTKRDNFTRNIVDAIFDALRASGKFSSDVCDASHKASRWKEILRSYQESKNLSYRQLTNELNTFGCTVQEQGIRQWLVYDGHIIGPRDESSLRQIAEMTQDADLLSDVTGYFNACRIVRRQRKKILKLIAEAIEEKLSGNHSSHNRELEIVYSNIENLSEILELEVIKQFKEGIFVQAGMINKPIVDMEVSL